MYLKEVSQKNKDGTLRTYLQLVQSRRVNGKPRQVLLVNLGRVDGDDGKEKIDKLTQALVEASTRLALFDAGRDLQADWSKEYGPVLIFKRLWEELGFKKVLGAEFEDVQTQFDLREAIFNMVLNRLTQPSSKRQLNLWEEDIYSVQPFSLQHYYRAMDYLIEHKDKMEEGIFYQMKDLLNQEVDMVLFDTTSLVYFGEGDEAEKLLERGFSKDRRSDLKQIIVGVLMSKEGIPLGHEVFAGNTNDVTCFRHIIDKVKDRFQIGKVILVGDRGMITKKNVEYLEEKKYEYILSFRMRTLPKEERSHVLSKADLKTMRKLHLQFKEVTLNGKRLIVCYNAERAETDKKTREEILERIREKITNGNILSVVDNQSYKRFLKIEGKKPEIDKEKVERDEQYDGVFVLTSNTKLKPLEVVEYYKGLWQVEMALRQLKSELEMEPIYHWKDRRIQAHVMICFMALILRSVFYKKLTLHEKEVSWTQLMHDLKSLKAIGLKIKNSEVILRTELKAGANTAFRALGMRPPNRILSQQPLNNVVIRH
jgi:transposase